MSEHSLHVAALSPDAKQLHELLLDFSQIPEQYTKEMEILRIRMAQLEGRMARVRETEGLLSTLFQAGLGDGTTAAMTTNASGFILTWGASAKELYGYEPAEAKGKHVAHLEADCIDEPSHFHRRIQGLHKDGRVFPVDSFSSPVRNGDGRIVGYIRLDQVTGASGRMGSKISDNRGNQTARPSANPTPGHSALKAS